jgi:hypothetical protein
LILPQRDAQTGAIQRVTNISRGILQGIFLHEFSVATGFEIVRHGGQ